MRSIAPVRPILTRRRAIAARRSLAILVAILIAGLYGTAWCAQAETPAQKAAAREGPTRDIVERGNIESAKSAIVRCEVASPDNSGTTILQLVPEGKLVQSGEVLGKLDSSMWEEERNKQQIAVADSALVAKRTKDDLETAKLAKREYTEGTYAVQLQSIQNDIFVAENQLRRAEADLKALGQAAGQAVPARQLEDARFAEKKARNELDLAKARLQVLQKLTREKMLRQLSADVEAGESRLKVEETNLQFARERMTLIERQIANCTVRAPMAGAVVYANFRAYGGNADLIGEGLRVRERQAILRVDDLTQLQVKVRVNESRVSLIKAGMPVKIVVDAMPGRELAGTVASVGAYPEPASLLAPGLKEYAAIFRIDQPPPGLSVGLSAEVRIPVRGGAGPATALQGTSRDLGMDKFFQSWDRNADGRLDASEVPPAFWEQLKRYDTNGDGFIDRAEWRAMQEHLKRAAPR